MIDLWSALVPCGTNVIIPEAAGIVKRKFQKCEKIFFLSTSSGLIDFSTVLAYNKGPGGRYPAAGSAPDVPPSGRPPAAAASPACRGEHYSICAAQRGGTGDLHEISYRGL